MSERYSSELLIGGGLIVIGAIACFMTFQIEPDVDGTTSARLFPFIGSATLVLTGIMEMIRGLKTEGTPLHITDVPGKIAGMVLLSLFYGWAISGFGYLLSTAVVAPVALILFGVTNRIGLLSSMVLCPVIFHILFFELLGVFPPIGRHFDLLEILARGQ